ncbi:MAG: hypothetical protein WC464_08265 [Bdellovibrionales bacterium]
MTETKKTEFADINALAMEACDMWQEHLSNLANDPAARAELTRFLEPQRRLFADWAAMMRQGGVHETDGVKEQPSTGKNNASSSSASAPTSATATPPGDASHGDDPLRVAQLALRLAELEKRVAKLESNAAREA